MLLFHEKWKSLCYLEFRALLSKMSPVARNKITECSYFQRVSKNEAPSHSHWNSVVHSLTLLQKKGAKTEKYLQIVLGFSEKCDKIPLNDKMGKNIWYGFSQRGKHKPNWPGK